MPFIPPRTGGNIRGLSCKGHDECAQMQALERRVTGVYVEWNWVSGGGDPEDSVLEKSGVFRKLLEEARL